MQVIARRMVLAGAGTVALASVATVLLLRKPQPPVLVLSQSEPPPRLLGMEALRRISPPRALPPIGFTDAAGAKRSLAEFAGKAVVLNVWATWCVPCVAEMPALASLAARAASDRVMILPLSIDHGGGAAVRQFYAAHRIAGLGVWTDPEGDAGRALGIAGVPTTLIIDRRGRAVAQLEGPAEWGSDAALAAIRGLVG